MSKYPEHEKLKKVSKASQICGEFLSWLLSDEGGYVLAKYSSNDKLWQCNVSIIELLAEFFEIDQDKLEEEKRAMLEMLRERT